jgi:hypothetical protein
MAVDEYERMTNRPYKSKFNLADYEKPSSGGYTYTGEGASNKAGAGRGGRGGSAVDKLTAEARSDGTDAPPTDAMKQTMADERMKKAAEKAPTTKTEMGKRFKSGGVTRADGCITKGHTKGRMV